MPISTTLRESIRHAQTMDFFVQLVIDKSKHFEGIVHFVPDVHRNRHGRNLGMVMRSTFECCGEVEFAVYPPSRFGVVVMGESQKYFRNQHWKELRPSLVHLNHVGDRPCHIYPWPDFMPSWAMEQGYDVKVILEAKPADLEGGPFRPLYGQNFAILYFKGLNTATLELHFKTFVDEPNDEDSDSDSTFETD